MRAIRRGLLLLTLLTLASSLLAQQSTTTVPNLIRYGGVLKDARGAAMASRTVGITFLIYGQQDGSAPVWLETQNVATDAAGQYSVLLGGTTATGLPGDLFAQQEQRWLAVKTEGQPEQPRVLLVSVPYAMKAAVADTLAGHSASEFVTTDNLQSAMQQLQGQATSVAPGTAAGTNGIGTAAGSAPVPTNTATNFVDTTTNQVVLVQQNGTGVGLKASSPGNVGVLGTVSSTAKAGVVAGVEGTSGINNGFGVFGYSTATMAGIGVQGRSDSANGTGVRGWTIGTSGIAVNATSSATTGNPVGLYASVSAPGGTGALISNIASGTIKGPLINALTNNVTQFAVGATGNVSATGWFSGKQLISTVATGTAPLQVASTTQVPNLNASLLGGRPATAFIQNGTTTQAGTNFNISGNGTVGGTLSGNAVNAVNNSNNQAFQINGRGVFGVGSSGNLSLGLGAGSANTTGQGNTFVGSSAGGANTTGGANTFVGDLAGQANTTGGWNTFTGVEAGFSNLTGDANTFSGWHAGLSNATGNWNTFTGYLAGNSNSTGNFNTFFGLQAGYNITTGSKNIDIGENAGPTGDESGTIRIGNSTDQIATYIAGISGAATNSGVPVFIDSTGKLGTTGGSLGGVTSFNGRTGAVVPAANDYSFPQIAGTLSFLRLSGTLGSSQLSGTYTNPLTLNNTSNSFTGGFTGNGAGLTGVPVSAGSSNYIQNGTAQQIGANFNISGNGTAGSFNSLSNYQIGLQSVLGIGSEPDANVFLGEGVGLQNIAGQGIFNMFAGYQAGNQNTGGYYNAFYGARSGLSNTTGSANTFIGAFSGQLNTTGAQNIFVGMGAGSSNTSGSANIFVGIGAGESNTQGYDNSFLGEFSGAANKTGQSNVFLGSHSGESNTTGTGNDFVGAYAGAASVSGSNNNFYGFYAGSGNTTGSRNTFFGDLAGVYNTTGNNNIIIGVNAGQLADPSAAYNILIGNNGQSGQSYAIQIGQTYQTIASGCSPLPAPCGQNAAFIQGIWGSTIGSNGVAVYVDSNGQLGTVRSSRRFKEQIRDMGDSTNALMKLRPVTFLYKPEYDKGPRTLQYGLIAEEVAEIYPNLVAYEANGKPYTVKYQYLTTMLLNEMQKQYHRAQEQELNMKAQSEVIQTQQRNIQTQAEVMKTQQQEIDGLKAQLRLQNAAFQERLSRLESMIERQTQTALK